MKEEYQLVLNDLSTTFDRLKKIPEATVIICGSVPNDAKDEGNTLVASYGDIFAIAHMIHNLIKSNPLIILALTKIKMDEEGLSFSDVANIKPI
jgi:phosphoenolpyruvate synthase/pyruvate phosphate dikinase